MEVGSFSARIFGQARTREHSRLGIAQHETHWQTGYLRNRRSHAWTCFGYLSGGFLASLIVKIVASMALQDAIQTAKQYLRQHSEHEEVLEVVEKVEKLASAKVPNTVVGGARGAGWAAEEALAIALSSALVSPNLEEAVVLAVDHSGDSTVRAQSHEALPALYRADSIPACWLDTLELRDEIGESGR